MLETSAPPSQQDAALKHRHLRTNQRVSPVNPHGWDHRCPDARRTLPVTLVESESYLLHHP